MKKGKAIISILAALSIIIIPTGCANKGTIDVDNAVKVTFMLEGGTFQNSEEPLVYYYKFKGDGKEHLIHDPAAEKDSDRLSQSTIKRPEYTFDGWYRTRSEIDGHVVYSGQWDFKTDKVSDDGVTLYAKWSRLIHYTYQLYYEDEESKELVKLGKPYDVEEGEKFYDLFHLADTREGYTAVGFYDENGNKWDDNFTHPGGDVNTEIKVIVKYTKGQYVNVATAQQLINNYNKDIKLVADIDFGGAEFQGFADYRHLFDGQGHTIKNFKLTYRDTNSDLDDDDDLGDEGNILNISLFGKTSGAEVRNVKFENVTIDINTDNRRIKKIIVAPLCVKATDSVFENVEISSVYTVTKLPRGFVPNPDNFVKDWDDRNKTGCYFNSGSKFENIVVAVDDRIKL